MIDSQKQIQSLYNVYHRLQGGKHLPCIPTSNPSLIGKLVLQSAIDGRQALESQRQENLGVQKEFSKNVEESAVYKLIGPVLLKQDPAEATLAVDARLDFIRKEIERLEEHIQTTQEESEKSRMEIYRLENLIKKDKAEVTARDASLSQRDI